MPGGRTGKLAAMPRSFVIVLFVMLGVLGVYFGIGACLPDHWQVATTRSLPCSLAMVQEQVGDLSRWQQWCGMNVTLGANTVCQASGTPGSSEQQLVWRGSQGTVDLLVLDYTPTRGIRYELGMQRQAEARSALGTGSIEWQEQDGEVRVTWTEGGRFDSYPARWSGWFGAVQEHVRQNQEAGLGLLGQQLDAPK